jgi:Domain of unknown function (DUF4337)
MDADVKTESSDKRLSNLVAVTVVILSVFMAVTKIKDDNINQAMQKAKAESVDAWSEYQAAEFEADIKKYEERSKETRAKAEGLEKEYDRLNFRDDQFDMSDAFSSIAIAVAAVASLVDSFWLLYVAWGSGALGMSFGIAGFLGFNFRPEWLAQLLGT